MEKGKKGEIRKPGVEYLIEQGYKKVSAKTFINDADLEDFLNKNFTNINKTRALGFIQILEREYNVDLSELKEAYLEYDGSHKAKEPETIFVETPMKNEKPWQKYLPYVIPLFVILGLALFLFYPNNNQSGLTSNLVKQVEENKSIIKEAQKNIKKIEENESKKLVDTEVNLTGQYVQDDAQDMDLDLDKVVLKMMKDRNISIDDHNISDDLNVTSEIQTKQTELKTAMTIQPEKPIVKEADKPEQKKKEATTGELYIIPTQKAWVGVIYLDNFTKKDFLIRSKLPLDASRDQLIIIGHKYFRIYNKTYSVKFRGSGPVRFIYKNGELMEINKKEFTRTSAGVGW